MINLPINANTIFLIICGISAVVILYALFSMFGRGAEPSRKVRRESRNAGGLGGESAGERIQKLQEQVHYLENDLAKTREDYTALLKELDVVKQREDDLKRELERRDQWVGKDEASFNKLRERNFELEGRFKTKQKELEEEFAKNVNLNKNLREISQKLEIMEQENKRMVDVIEAQKHQIEKYIKETQQFIETISQLREQQAESEWVPKAEFNKLNEEYTELERELEAQEEKVRKFGEEIIRLKSQLTSHQQVVGRQEEDEGSAQQKTETA